MIRSTFTFTKAATTFALATALSLGCADHTGKNDNDRERAPARQALVPGSNARPLVQVLPETPPPAKAVVTPARPELARAAAPEPAPKRYTELLAAAKRQLVAGKRDAAIELLSRAADDKPKRARPRMELARIYLDAGDRAKARAHAEVAVELGPRVSAAWNTLGRVELAEGKAEAAITSFTRATDENPDNSHAWNNLGFVHLVGHNYQEAVTALERATSGTTPTEYMWNNLGMAYEHLDRIELSRAAYRQASTSGSVKARDSLARLEGVVSRAVDAVFVIEPGSTRNAAAVTEPGSVDASRSVTIVPAPETAALASASEGATVAAGGGSVSGDKAVGHGAMPEGATLHK